MIRNLVKNGNLVRVKYIVMVKTVLGKITGIENWTYECFLIYTYTVLYVGKKEHYADPWKDTSSSLVGIQVIDPPG